MPEVVAHGVDYSWGRPGGAAIAAAGFSFAMRYVPYRGDEGKGITADEVADLHANGIAIGFVLEREAAGPLHGYHRGSEDADICLAAARALGIPPGTAFYFALDWDTTPQDYAAIEAYILGFADLLADVAGYRIGVYGELDVVEWLYDKGLVDFEWQCLAWSGGVVYEGADLYQYRNGQTINGAPVDYNYAYTADFGQWPQAKEEDMGLSEDQQRILRALADLQVGPPTSETNADGERADRLEAQVALGAPIIDRLASQNNALLEHKDEPHGGEADPAQVNQLVKTALHIGADGIGG